MVQFYKVSGLLILAGGFHIYHRQTCGFKSYD